MPTKPGVPSTAALRYEPKFNAQVVEFMGRGYSLTAFAGEIGTSRSNLLKWCRDHPPFAAAVERAQARRARLLEDRMLGARGAGAFGAHMQALKTAAPDEWPGKRPARGPAGPPGPTGAGLGAEIDVDLPDNGRA